MANNYVEDNSPNKYQFQGNILFASYNQIQGNKAKPKDDLESLLYLVTFLYNQKKLPWTSHLQKIAQREDATIIDMLKERRNHSDLFET